MSIFLLIQRNAKLLSHLSNFRITKKISFSKKRDIGMEKLKKEIHLDNEDFKRYIAIIKLVEYSIEFYQGVYGEYRFWYKESIYSKMKKLSIEKCLDSESLMTKHLTMRERESLCQK